jgi:predicted secreted protein
MHVAPAESRAGVFLNTEHFALIARLLNLTSDAAIARAFRVNPITISRAREGVIGEKFIAAAVSYFGEHADELAKYSLGAKFEDLFEIREKGPAA